MKRHSDTPHHSNGLRMDHCWDLKNSMAPIAHKKDKPSLDPLSNRTAAARHCTVWGTNAMLWSSPTQIEAASMTLPPPNQTSWKASWLVEDKQKETGSEMYQYPANLPCTLQYLWISFYIIVLLVGLLCYVMVTLRRSNETYFRTIESTDGKLLLVVIILIRTVSVFAQKSKIP